MLVKKAAALLENSDAIKRVEKLYYAYVYHQGHSTDTSSFVSDKTQDELDLPLLFYRPNSLSKIGNLVMSIKVCDCYFIYMSIEITKS